jgi:hypothetical protein
MNKNHLDHKMDGALKDLALAIHWLRRDPDFFRIPAIWGIYKGIAKEWEVSPARLLKEGLVKVR